MVYSCRMLPPLRRNRHHSRPCTRCRRQGRATNASPSFYPFPTFPYFYCPAHYQPPSPPVPFSPLVSWPSPPRCSPHGMFDCGRATDRFCGALPLLTPPSRPRPATASLPRVPVVDLCQRRTASCPAASITAHLSIARSHGLNSLLLPLPRSPLLHAHGSVRAELASACQIARW